MRTAMTLAASALALAACANGANVTASNATATTDMTVPANDMVDNADVVSAPVTTDTFVKTAAMSDMFEVAAGKIAVDKASDPAVRGFAKDMVAAHTATTKALKAAVAKDGVAMTAPAALDTEHQAMIDALKAADGAAFDTLYKSQQHKAHTAALALMKSYAASGDKPSIKAAAADTAPKVQMHIDMLGKLG